MGVVCVETIWVMRSHEENTRHANIANFFFPECKHKVTNFTIAHMFVTLLVLSIKVHLMCTLKKTKMGIFTQKLLKHFFTSNEDFTINK